jgi:putative transposase
VRLDGSRPGKPVDNRVCGAFTGSFRRECLSQHWFATLAEAQLMLDARRQDYNHHRPHTTLGLHTPAV